MEFDSVLIIWCCCNIIWITFNAFLLDDRVEVGKSVGVFGFFLLLVVLSPFALCVSLLIFYFERLHEPLFRER